MEEAPAQACLETLHLATVKRGLKTGLSALKRTVLLMLDECIITETPPLYSCYCRIGEQASVPITGKRENRILHGVMNIRSGDVVLFITDVWNGQTHQHFLKMLRAHWRGWRIVIFEDRGTPHIAEESRELAAELGIKLRLLPRATPELNAMDHLWRSVKGRALSNRPTRSIDKSADAACNYILEMDPTERRRKAGIFSGDFWLAR